MYVPAVGEEHHLRVRVDDALHPLLVLERPYELHGRRGRDVHRRGRQRGARLSAAMEAPHTSRVSASGLERLQQQVAELVDAGLYDSAEALGSFLVSGAAAAARGGAGAGPAHLVLLADALVGRREHRRALVHYRQALQLARITQKEVRLQGLGMGCMLGFRVWAHHAGFAAFLALTGG